MEPRLFLAAAARSLPFDGAPSLLPQAIEMEDYDRGGGGVAYRDISAVNAGGAYRPRDGVDIYHIGNRKNAGYFIGQARPGEWLQYTIDIPVAGLWDMDLRVASLGRGGKLHLEVDRVRKTPSFAVPDTGGWQKFVTITRHRVPLTAGRHILRIVMDSPGAAGYIGSLDWFHFTLPDPAAPRALSAEPRSGSEIALAWKDNADNEAQYLVERRAGPEDAWQQVAALAANTTAWTDSGLAPASEYQYRIRAANLCGASDYAGPADAMTDWDASPIIITSGGTYSGMYQSLDPDTPAVLIATSEPVIIDSARIRGRGDLIQTAGSSASLTIRNTTGYGMNPDRPGAAAGRFLSAEDFVNIDLENNGLQGTTGIYLYNYLGDGSAAQTVTILRNVSHNIDGRYSDGAGGYLASANGNPGAQFVQCDAVHGLSGAQIAWNQVINDPGTSLVEDNISIHDSSGAPASPILIHDNYIQGAYPADPANDADYTGGGIMLSDNGSSWVRAFSNQVIATSNYGIAISSGHDNEFYGNRIIASGQLPDGTPIAAQNVGAYVWNANGEAGFTRNFGHNNLIGWATPSGRNDFWSPAPAAMYGNQSLADPITPATEAGEWSYWLDKLLQHAATVGPAIGLKSNSPITVISSTVHA